MAERLTKVFLYDEYIIKDKTIRKISEETKIHQAKIRYHIRKHKLPKKDNLGKNNPNYKHGKYSIKENNYRLYRKLIDEKNLCEECGLKHKQMDIHHINMNHSDDRVENLKVLCSKCHSTHHRNYEWNNTRDKNKILRDNKGRFKNKK